MVEFQNIEFTYGQLILCSKKRLCKFSINEVKKIEDVFMYMAYRRIYYL